MNVPANTEGLAGTTPEPTVAGAIANASVEGLLLLLDERHPVYEGRSENAVHRIRGWILNHVVVSDERFLPFIREELETGTHAYSVAAAARALRSQQVNGGAWRPLLESALVRVKDDSIQFHAYPLEVVKGDTSAKAELRRILEEAPRQAGVIQISSVRSYRESSPILDLVLEDQEGSQAPFHEIFLGRPSFVTFFYTRCNNPAKCSANIMRWAELGQRLAEHLEEVNLAAITYDPLFDTPDRLKRYAEQREAPLGNRIRLFRAPDQQIDLERHFALQVGYGQATVNRHASEAHVLSAEGVIVKSYSRVPWTIDEVIAELLAEQ